MQIQVKTQGQVLYWTLHHPEQGNALGPSFIRAFDQELQKLEAHCAQWRQAPDEVKLAHRVLVIGASPAGRQRPVWIAGGNLKELATLTSKAAGGAYAAAMSGLCARLEQLPLPVVMAIHGEAIGGGAEFALAGDLRLATTESGFDFKQLSIGLATGYGSASRLLTLLGRSRASQLMFLRMRLSGAEALSWGLVHQLLPDANTLATAVTQLSTELCQIEPQALACQKAMLLGSACGAERAREAALFEELWFNPTHRTFLQRFP